MNNKFRIACIGSRSITPAMEKLLQELGEFIVKQDWLVASGNALGSDQHFVIGANRINPQNVLLYLPWASYNKELIVEGNRVNTKILAGWEDLAARNHPNWNNLTSGARSMMIRNAGIISRADVVLAVLNHKKIGGGGTGHGFRCAKELGVPRVDISGIKDGNPTIKEVCDFLISAHEKKNEKSFDFSEKLV